MDLTLTAEESAAEESTSGTASAEERRLVERARTDPEAFALLYRRNYAALGRYLQARTGDVHATEDLLAETFLAALKGLGGFRQRGVPFRWWLLRIASRAANRWARREGRRPRALEAGAEPVAPDDRGRDPAQEDERLRVHRLLLRLSPRHQTVLLLHYLEGLEVQEIARALGCRPGTVKSRLARARDALRRLLPDSSSSHTSSKRS